MFIFFSNNIKKGSQKLFHYNKNGRQESFCIFSTMPLPFNCITEYYFQQYINNIVQIKHEAWFVSTESKDAVTSLGRKTILYLQYIFSLYLGSKIYMK